MASAQKVWDIVTEAQTSRGWTVAESEQIIEHLICSGGDAELEPETACLPFGKYEHRSIRDVFSDNPQYIHWLTTQAWFLEKYPVFFMEIIQLIRAGARQ